MCPFIFGVCGHKKISLQTRYGPKNFADIKQNQRTPQSYLSPHNDAAENVYWLHALKSTGPSWSVFSLQLQRSRRLMWAEAVAVAPN